MSRILKALLKTIVVVLGITLLIFLANMFPYILATLIIIALAIFLFISFYENEEDQLMNEEVKELLNKCNNCNLKECIRL